MNKQLIKTTIAEIIHLTPARQAEACYSVTISEKDHDKISVQLQPSLQHLTWTRIGSRNRKDLYESMVFHTGLALGNLTVWLEEQDIHYSVSRTFPTPCSSKCSKAINLLAKNTDFIAYETTTWIELQRLGQTSVFKNYQYDSTKCHRDLKFVLDALCRDLEYFGNENIRSVLMEYFDKDGKWLVRKNVELCAYGFVKNLINDVLNLRTPETLYQAHTQQCRQEPIAESDAILWANDLVDMVISVLDKGISSLPYLIEDVSRQQDKIEVLIDV